MASQRASKIVSCLAVAKPLDAGSEPGMTEKVLTFEFKTYSVIASASEAIQRESIEIEAPLLAPRILDCFADARNNGEKCRFISNGVPRHIPRFASAVTDIPSSTNRDNSSETAVMAVSISSGS